MVLGFSRLVAGEKERDRVKKVGTQTCAAKGKKEQFLRCVPQRTENELRDGGKGKWESLHCEGFGVTQAEISNQQLPIGPLLEGKTEMKVKSWIPYSLRVRYDCSHPGMFLLIAERCDCGPDHQLLSAKFKLKLKKVGKNHWAS